MIRQACAAVLGVFAFGAAANAGPPAPAPAPQFNLALAIAQKQVPGCILITARSEQAVPANVFGFYFLLRGIVVEVEVSQTGKVVKHKQSDKDVVSKDVMALLAKTNGPAKMPAGRLL